MPALTNKYPKTPGRPRVRLTVDVSYEDYFIIKQANPFKGGIQNLLSSLLYRFATTLQEHGTKALIPIITGQILLAPLSDTRAVAGPSAEPSEYPRPAGPEESTETKTTEEET